MTDVLEGTRRIVVKVGSSLVTNEGKGIDAEAVGNWCRPDGGAGAPRAARW